MMASEKRVEKARQVVAKRREIEAKAKEAGVSPEYVERVGYEDVAVVDHGVRPLSERTKRLIGEA